MLKRFTYNYTGPTRDEKVITFELSGPATHFGNGTEMAVDLGYFDSEPFDEIFEQAVIISGGVDLLDSDEVFIALLSDYTVEDDVAAEVADIFRKGLADVGMTCGPAELMSAQAYSDKYL